LARLANELQLQVLFEIHERDELDKLNEYIHIVGVNNRNLKNFSVDINLSIELANKIPAKYIKISESGINNPEPISVLKKYGYKGFLIGENFMKEEDPVIAFKNFIKEL
jgi:indole-3-glycerol phosphate synthase